MVNKKIVFNSQQQQQQHISDFAIWENNIISMSEGFCENIFSVHSINEFTFIHSLDVFSFLLFFSLSNSLK